MIKLFNFKLIGVLLVFSGLSGALHAQTTSIFPPSEENLGLYVVNSGPGLDTGCSFRSQGPLVINLHVPVTMNPAFLNSDGTIKKDMKEKLIENKVISKTARISFPVWDIDSDANVTGIRPEINIPYFNGTQKKSLEGRNNQWVMSNFEVDIGEVRFGKDNIIKIEIDTANTVEAWCMAVDWVSITFDAAYPYVLAHGINAKNNTWTWQEGTELKDGAYCDDDYDESNTVQKALREQGVLCKVFFIDGKQATGDCAKKDDVSGEKSTGRNGTAVCNAKELKWKIDAFLKLLKAKKVNIIAHSKGGLDSQALAKHSTPEFEIHTLSTLSTPHLGSVVADMQILQRESAKRYDKRGTDPNKYVEKYITFSPWGQNSGELSVEGNGPQPPGLNDLVTINRIEAITGVRSLTGISINPNVSKNVLKTFTLGADAGPECDEKRELTDGEISPMANGARWYAKGSLENLLRLAYNATCRIYAVEFLGENSFYNPLTKVTTLAPIYKTHTLSDKGLNDISVSASSANPWWGTSLGDVKNQNHTTMKNDTNIKKIFEKTREFHLHTNLQ